MALSINVSALSDNGLGGDLRDASKENGGGQFASLPWVPNALLAEGLAVMKSWGFTYKQI
jgi:hypothetical protein